VLAKNEVDRSFNIALSVNLISNLGEESILVPVEAHPIVALLSIVGGQSNGLRSFAVSVFDIDIVKRSVLSKVDDGTSGFVISGATGKT
jgi:hypothetical protein